MSDNSEHFPPKSVVFREGEEAGKLFIIKSGEVLCLKASKERFIPVFMAKEQDIIGESAMLTDAPYTYSAIAMGQVELISIPNRDFLQVLDSSPQWLIDLTLTMIARFQSTSSLIAENRILHENIISEEDFPSSLEIELKKILVSQ